MREFNSNKNITTTKGGCFSCKKNYIYPKLTKNLRSMWWNCRIFRHRQYHYSNHLGNIGILLRYRSFPIYYYGTDNTERQSKIQQITALSNNNPNDIVLLSAYDFRQHETSHNRKNCSCYNRNMMISIVVAKVVI